MNHQPYPDHLFHPETRHQFVFAHQDDEIQYGGLIQRLGPDTRFLWVTNGDGLAPMENADPPTYAAMRMAETDEVLKTLGRPLSHRRCLAVSEIEIYDHFVELTLNPSRRDEVMDYFHRIGCAVYAELRERRPRVVWVCQYQQGQPEHDLAHLLAACALRQLRREEGLEAELYQLPEYEYTILIPLRFHPWYPGVVHHIDLTDEELERKRKAFLCYPSQVKLFGKFERVIGRIGKVAGLFGKGFTLETFLRREQFGPVPPDFDYTKSFHRFEWANYMFDKHKDVKVRFDRHLSVIARELKDRPFTV